MIGDILKKTKSFGIKQQKPEGKPPEGQPEGQAEGQPEGQAEGQAEAKDVQHGACTADHQQRQEQQQP